MVEVLVLSEPLIGGLLQTNDVRIGGKIYQGVVLIRTLVTVILLTAISFEKLFALLLLIWIV